MLSEPPSYASLFGGQAVSQSESADNEAASGQSEPVFTVEASSNASTTISNTPEQSAQRTNAAPVTVSRRPRKPNWCKKDVWEPKLKKFCKFM